MAPEDELRKVLNSPKNSEKIKLRAQILWNILVEGHTISYTSSALSVSRPTIYRWLNRYTKDGVSGILNDAYRIGRPPKKERKAILTTREMQILKLASIGKTSWETAIIMGISEKTVNTYFENIKLKLGVNNKTFAVAEAMRVGALR